METINTIEKRREDQSVIPFFHFDFEYDSQSSPRLMTLVLFCLVFDYFVVKKLHYVINQDYGKKRFIHQDLL